MTALALAMALGALMPPLRSFGKSLLDQGTTGPAEAQVQYAAAFPVSSTLIVTASAPLQDATEIDLLLMDGTSARADVVRTDSATGLALLRVQDQKLAYLPLADDFKGGAIQCAALPKVDIFNPTVEMLAGDAPAPAARWKVRLNKNPQLPGAPILVDGKVVGVQLGDGDASKDALPAATLAQLKAFVGADLPTTEGKAAPENVMIQITANR